MTNQRTNVSGLVLLDVAFALFGALVLYLVVRWLSFDAPNPLQNAWTYVLGVPTVVVAVSMLTHVLSNEVIERSIQVGFLASVSVHLLLAISAIHFVMFQAVWPTNAPMVSVMPTKAKTKVPQYYQPSPSTSLARPDYLKPIETDNQQASELPAEIKKLTESTKLQLEVARESIKASLAEKSFEQDRRTESIPVPTIRSSAAKLDRPDLASNRRVTQEMIDVPTLERTESEPTLENIPKPIDIERSQTTGSSSIAKTIDLEIRDVPRASISSRTIQQSPSVSPRKSIDQQLQQSMSEMQLPSPTLPNRNELARNDRPVTNAIPVPRLSQNDSKESSQFDPVAQAVDTEVVKSTDSRASRSDSWSITSSLGEFSPSLSASNWRAERASQEMLSARTGSSSGTNREKQPQSQSAEFLKDPRFQEEGLAGGVRSILGGETMGRVSSNPTGNSTVPIEFEAGIQERGTANDEVLATELSPGEVSISKSTMPSKNAGSINAPHISLPDVGRESWTGSKNDLPRKTLSSMDLESVVPELRATDFAPERLTRPELAGPKFAASSVPIPTPAFSQRLKRIQEREIEAASELGPLGPQTELAIERGLQFLAKYQRADGSWNLGDFGQPVRMQSNTAATALALLSFQGAGYTHRQFKYESVCKGALFSLVDNQKENGDLYQKADSVSDANAWLYSHAIASLALCEAYGMTQDETIRGSAQKAIDFLVASQDPVGGGWRYAPRVGSDTSVTGWVMMAFKSAELSGLDVPKKVYVGIQKWLDNSQDKEAAYLYRYNWQANTPTTQHGRIPTPVMTSVGLLMRLYTGWRRDNLNMQKGTRWLLGRLPSVGTVRAPARDTYYWYYATQVMFHAGGDTWKKWYGTLYPMLIQSQQGAGEYVGSWEPGGPIPDAWGEFGGRLYVTTLNLLSLEVYYRHLPLYEATAE
jgi:hypothetical protein